MTKPLIRHGEGCGGNSTVVVLDEEQLEKQGHFQRASRWPWTRDAWRVGILQVKMRSTQPTRSSMTCSQARLLELRGDPSCGWEHLQINMAAHLCKLQRPVHRSQSVSRVACFTIAYTDDPEITCCSKPQICRCGWFVQSRCCFPVFCLAPEMISNWLNLIQVG